MLIELKAPSPFIFLFFFLLYFFCFSLVGLVSHRLLLILPGNLDSINFKVLLVGPWP